MQPLLSDQYYKNYTAPILSCATFISLILFVLLIILPYFLADFSGGFWSNTSVFFEQPNVTYNDQMILYATDDDNVRYFSSMIQLNDHYVDSLLPIPMVKYEDFDINNNGLIDQFIFKVNFYTKDPTLVSNIKLLLLFDYHIITRIDEKMQTMAVIDINTPMGASYVRVEGDLRIRQKAPMDVNTFLSGNLEKNLFENHDLIEYDDLIDIFNERPISTILDYEKIVLPKKNSNVVQLEIIVNIPSFEEFRIATPPFTQLKFAWIQYLAMFLPIAVVFYLIMMFIFTNRIFQCTTVSDLPKFKIR